MIRFSCKHCGRQFKVSEQNAGKKGKCPQCKNPIVVPTLKEQATVDSSIIKFRCPNCNQKIGLKKGYAGKQVRCAKCKNLLTVPGGAVKPPISKDRTEVLRAGAEQKADSGEMWGDLGALEALQQAEAKASAMERPVKQADDEYKLAQPAPPPVPPPDEFADFQRPTVSYDSKPKTKSKTGYILASVNGFITFISVCMIVSAIISMGDFANIDESIPESAKLQAEQFINALQSKNFIEAKSLFTTQSQATIESDKLNAFSKQLGQPKDITYSKSPLQNDGEKETILLYCGLEYEDDYQNITILMQKEYEEYKIDSASISHFMPNKIVSLGTYSSQELEDMALEEIKSFFGVFAKYFCTFCFLALISGIIYIISCWVVFDKAGEPGWAILIPFYNMWVMAKVGDKPGWCGLIAIACGAAPFVGPFIQLSLLIWISIGIAQVFGRGTLFGIGLAILPQIFFPILAFSSD